MYCDQKSIPNNSPNIQTFVLNVSCQQLFLQRITYYGIDLVGNVPLGNESSLIWLEVILPSLMRACFGESLMFPIFDPHQYNVPHH